jgi:2-polyprenyl-6-methoxyphenol hydroxylase-like FAD-dependent oxidoreductase
VKEAQRLGLWDAISRVGHELPFLDIRAMGMALPRRDVVATTAHRAPNFAIYHPTLQEHVIAEAEKGGAEIRRGATARLIRAGDPPQVEVEWLSKVENLRPRLVIAADGRGSNARTWCGFEIRREPDRYYIAGLLLENLQAPPDAALLGFNPMLGQTGYLFPQGENRARAYAVYPVTADFRLQGAAMVQRFIDESIHGGVPAEFFEDAHAVGPLASFISADHWVEHPYAGGVVLVGDAAGASDPIWGKGLSLTLRDARVLTELLRSNDNWDASCHEYARQHNAYFGVLHALDNAMRELLVDPGLQTDERRQRALALIAQDPTRLPDAIAGPDTPFDEAARQRMFGED